MRSEAMPWKEPENFVIYYAVAAAALTALLRNLYFGGRCLRTYLVEAALIGCITLGVGFAFKAAGIDTDYVYAAGAILAFFGVDFIRAVGERLVEQQVRRYEKKPTNHDGV